MSRVSLVVLTHNRADELMRTLRWSTALPERPRVIVVDNASTDDTAERVAHAWPPVALVRLPRNIGAAARNAGVERAETPYVALSDDDTCWAPGSLARAVELLDTHPALACVTARILVGAERRMDPASLEMAASPLPAEGFPGPRLMGFMAGASVFRRSAFLEAGGFEPRLFLGAEERLLAYDLAALGWSIAYCDELTVHHFPSKVRDASARRLILERNKLWIAWLRRPLAAALRQTRRTSWPARLAALRGAAWVLRHRRVLPPELDRWCVEVEEPELFRRRRGAAARPRSRPDPATPRRAPRPAAGSPARRSDGL